MVTFPTEATLLELSDWQNFDIYEYMPPTDTLFQLVEIQLAHITHLLDGATVQEIFHLDPPTYFAEMQRALHRNELAPIIITQDTIIDGYHRLLVAIAEDAKVICAYV